LGIIHLNILLHNPRRAAKTSGIAPDMLNSNEMAGRSLTAERLYDLASPCRLCPRECGAPRAEGERGECGVGLKPLVASAAPHFGEERELVGRGGSGTIFFAGCNLACIFCQNYDLSHLRAGREATPSDVADMMLELQRRGCENINFVTPTHMAPAVAAATEEARERGLAIPVVYNSGGYDGVEALRLLEGYVDVYMPDAKYGPAARSLELSGVPDYFDRMREALREMHRQVGDLVGDGRGLATRGLLVRHLVLPAGLADGEPVLKFLAEELSPDTYVNIMAQYRPCYRADEVPGLMRPPTWEEIEKVKDIARGLGLHRGF
jgi:putative pyruvate formate lyase activating enzyme